MKKIEKKFAQNEKKGKKRIAKKSFAKKNLEKKLVKEFAKKIGEKSRKEILGENLDFCLEEIIFVKNLLFGQNWNFNRVCEGGDDVYFWTIV